jgi:hypothetical protein
VLTDTRPQLKEAPSSSRSSDDNEESNVVPTRTVQSDPTKHSLAIDAEMLFL